MGYTDTLTASFERNLNKKGYSASIINDLVFVKTRKILQYKQEQQKKQGKGNRYTQRIGSFDKGRVQSIVRQGFVRYVMMLAVVSGVSSPRPGTQSEASDQKRYTIA